MKKQKYKLSICMMVKNEENNLTRCLDSLQLLLARADIELIIVDTGSTDNSVEIAKQYSDKVFFHDWNNNFSDMRNITISYAIGEWIFILDADEQLNNPSDLLNLLSNNKLNKYNTVQFYMHDFVKKADPDTYLTYLSFRLFKNDGFKYDGAVHNQPNAKNPVLCAPIVLNHYGYQFDDKELLERKFKRTSDILISELEKDPSNIYYRYQLANSYYIHGDYRLALEQARRGYHTLVESSSISRRDFSFLYAEYARDSYANLEFKECITIALEGLEIRPDYIDLIHYTSISYQALNDSTNAIKYAEKYVELIGEYEELEIFKDASIILMCVDQSSKNIIHSLLIAQYYRLGDYEKSLKYALKYNETEEVKKLMIDCYFKLEQFENAYDIYQEYTNNDEELIKKYSGFIEGLLSQIHGDNKTKVIQLFGSGDNQYSFFNKIRVAEGELGKILTTEFIRSTNFNESDTFYAEVFKNINRDYKEILSAFKKIKSFQLKLIIKFLLDHYTSMESYLLKFLLEENYRSTDYESNRVYSCIANVLYLQEIENAKANMRNIKEEYLIHFEKYVDHSINRLLQIYQVNKLRIHHTTLDSEEDQFFILLHFAEEAAISNNYKATLKYMKDAIKVYPYLALALSSYEKKLFAKLDEELIVNEK